MQTHDKPLVTIGLPVYNGEKFIRRALDSLLAQDYEHFELIISDNASTDGTSDICRGYAEKDPRIRYYRSETNRGAVWNFGRVLELAHGDYFMWAAHDDEWLPSFVSTLVDMLRRDHDATVAMCATQRFRDDALCDVVRFTDTADPSRMSNLQVATALASGKPYHLFIYGLYDLNFLKAASSIPNIIAGDRLFMCQLALGTRFLYVDKALYLRRIQQPSIAVKYANEELGAIWRDPLANWRKLLYAGPYLFRSKVIPLDLKVWIPYIVCVFWLRSSVLSDVYPLLNYWMGKMLGVEKRDRLRRFVRRVLGMSTTV